MDLKIQKNTLSQEIQFLQNELNRLETLKTQLLTTLIKKQGQIELIDEMQKDAEEIESAN